MYTRNYLWLYQNFDTISRQQDTLPYGKETRMSARITDGLISLSAGIEKVDDLFVDLDQALEKVKDSHLTAIGV